MPSIRTNSVLFPKGKMGNVDRFANACGEADVQPSLLPANLITGIPFCQESFSNFFIFFPAVNILFPDGYNHAVGNGPQTVPHGILQISLAQPARTSALMTPLV
jgi:hypothetical protein